MTDQVAALSCWSGAITCKSLAGGLTNRNYLVRDGGQQFVARLCDDRQFLGIDRRNERLCQIAAGEAGVAPEVTHFEQGILVSRFLDARTLADDDLQELDLLQRLAQIIRQIHSASDRLTGELLFFCPFQTVRTYTQTARDHGAVLPPDIDQLVEDSRKMSHQMSPFRPTLCHNDLLAANIMDDGDRLWIVDWEYGGIGNPLFDLAGVSANAGLSNQMEVHLLEAYTGSVSDTLLHEVRILKTASLLRESLWAVIQTVMSDFDFDYAEYATENFAKYRQARLDLDKAS
jgi:thiamine kinase-like enzyme